MRSWLIALMLVGCPSFEPPVGDPVDASASDGGVLDGAGVDSTPDSLVPLCPGFNALNGTPNHLYKRITAPGNWDTQRNSCAATSTTAYLAIPDDGAELQALSTLAGGVFWVGIDDLATENTFLTVKQTVATFLPWAAGEPDDTLGGQDCVTANSATQIATDKCSTLFAAICECEP